MTASVTYLPFTHHKDTASDVTLLNVLEERQQRRINYRGELGRLIERRQIEINNLKARIAR